MILLLQVIGVLAAGVVLAAIVVRRTSAATVAGMVAALAVALGYVAFATHVWGVGQLFALQHRTWSPLTPDQAALAGTPPVQGAFAEWIRPHLRPGDRFFIVPATAREDPGVLQWFTYRLLPNLSADDLGGADVLIFYDTTPKASGYIHQISGRAQIFGAGYSIARTRHAG
jgi:hypothetical protein